MEYSKEWIDKIDLLLQLVAQSAWFQDGDEETDPEETEADQTTPEKVHECQEKISSKNKVSAYIAVWIPCVFSKTCMSNLCLLLLLLYSTFVSIVVSIVFSMHFTTSMALFTVTSSFWLRPSSLLLSFLYIEEEPPPPISTP